MKNSSFPSLTHQMMNIKIFFDLWKRGLLKDYERYGLVVENGKPVLFVLLDKKTLRKTEMEVSRHFQDPAFFLPCKTARWEDSTIDKEFERTLDVDDDVREVSRLLNAEEGGQIVARNTACRK
jgi:hypothetical protein